MRVAAAACSVLIAALLALDPLLSRHEEARLKAMLDGRFEAATASEPAAELAEVGLGQGALARRWDGQGPAVAAARTSNEKDSLKALERLKGWLEHETSEDPY
jgi:hypothetical protein